MAPPVLEGRSAPAGASTPVAASHPAGPPAAGRVEVTLGGVGTSGLAPSFPIEVAGADAADSDTRLGVEVLDQAVSQAAGINGFAFRLTAPGIGLVRTSRDALPVDVTVDVSGLAGTYGGNYLDRLHVVALPACAVVSPRPAGCDVSGQALRSTRTGDGNKLRVELDDLNRLVSAGLEGDVTVAPDQAGVTAVPDAPAAGTVASEAPAAIADSRAATRSTTTTTTTTATTTAPTATTATTAEPPSLSVGAPLVPSSIVGGDVVLAVTSGPEGEAGTYRATPFNQSAEWRVGAGTGEFSWSYPIQLPTPPAGQAPSVAAQYSSGAVDGMVTSGNSQASALGLGWADFANAFVERRYARCTDEGFPSGDLCWKEDNASLSLNGHAAELVPVDAAHRQWRLRNDPNWRVERFDSSDPGFGVNPDSDRERWRVTTPDGTQYWFGREVEACVPGAGLGTAAPAAIQTVLINPCPNSDSVWTVPVWGDDPGDACYQAPPATNLPCDQAWRWNLDSVVDPNGNEMRFAYWRERNRYLAANGYLGEQWYTMAGGVYAIVYGIRGGDSRTSTNAVRFDTDLRCSTFPAGGCPAIDPRPSSEGGNAELFPDVPSDLLCFGAAPCTATSPTFFTIYRYTAAHTFSYGQGTPDVDTVAFFHTFLDDGFGNLKLWLAGIQRTGHTAATNITLPQVNFLGTLLPNRVDTGGVASKAMPHHRIGFILDEFGRQTYVTYGQQSPCPTNPFPTGNWDTNTADCFPQKWLPPGASQSVFTVFNKYEVAKVEVRDPIGGSPPIVTSYTYEGPAAWHHQDDEFVSNLDQSWSDWRGYEKTKVTVGNTTTRTQVFRGMNGDRLAGDPVNGPGRRVSTVTPLDGSAAAAPDDNWMMGQVLYQEQLSGTTRLVKTLSTYTTEVTAPAPGPDPQDAAHWVAPSAVTESRANGAAFKQRRTTTSYNAQRMPSRVFEEGWLDVATDDRCTRTSYAVNASLYMIAYPSGEVLVSGNCDSTNDVRRSETAYDDLAVGAAPTRGNPTSTRSRVNATTWNPPTVTSYDALGRPHTVTNPNLQQTTYDYSPATGNPTSSTVTNPLGHVQRTDWNVRRGLPSKQTDANQKATTFEYDALGRTTKVFLPTEQAAGSPASYQFAYAVAPNRDGPAIVQSRQLQSASPLRYLDSWILYDANLHEHQTQSLSPTSGKVIVTQSTYDDTGRLATTTGPQALTGSPGLGYLPAPTAGWDNTSAHAYDELSRPIWDLFFAGSTARRGTTTSYGADTVTVRPPSGARVRTTTDAFGRTAMVEEEEDLDGGVFRPTKYSYNAAGDLLTVEDPALNRIVYTYDMLGRRQTIDDPDAGDWSFGYDAVGNMTSVTDANQVQVHTTYDGLNRPKERHRDSVNGPRLAKWDYDAQGELGLLNSSTRFDASGAWVVDVTGYDDRARPTGRAWTVPAGVSGLTGTYAVTYGYDRADHRTTVGYPAVGGLPAETVTTAYNSVGLPETMVGAEEYVWGALYDDRARPSWFLSGSRTTAFSQTFGYDVDQRLARRQAGAGTTVLLDHQYVYDPTGNVVDRATTLNGQSWRECFGYDGRQRLTQAFTTSGTCASGSPGSGAQPYNHTYGYSVDGNLTRRIEGSTTVNYTYPNPGATSVRPHAPTAVGGDSFTWDVNGSQATRTVAGQLNTLTWDAEHRLTLVDDPDGDTSMVYDASGERLLRRSPTGTTLYIEDHEITAPASGSTTAVRTYTFNGSTLATRSPARVEYLGTDHQGSVELSVRSGQATALTTRAYLPYGKPRGVQQFTTDRGWVNRTEDDSTGLDYLNARYYDPAIGRFIAPDPLYDQARPQTINPYTYGLSNPTTNADPTGLGVPVGAYTTSVLWDARFNSGTGGFSGGDPMSIPDRDSYLSPRERFIGGDEMYADPLTGSLCGVIADSNCSGLPTVHDPGSLSDQLDQVRAGFGDAVWGPFGGNPACELVAHRECLEGDPDSPGYQVGSFLGQVFVLAAAAKGTNPEAASAYDHLGASDDILVLGRRADTAVAENWPGHVVLNTPKWSLLLNDAVISGAILQRREVYLASPVVEGNLVYTSGRFAGEPTVFARELRQLTKAGYRRVGDYMVPPP